MEIKKVVIRKYNSKYRICYAESYQNAFRSSVNNFDKLEDAVEFIKNYNLNKNRDFNILYLFDQNDQLQDYGRSD